MRAHPFVYGIMVLGTLALGTGAASSAGPQIKLTKANVTYAEFQEDRDACVEAVKDAERRQAISSPGVNPFRIWYDSLYVNDYRKFFRCMKGIGYRRDAGGLDAGPL